MDPFQLFPITRIIWQVTVFSFQSLWSRNRRSCPDAQHANVSCNAWGQCTDSHCAHMTQLTYGKVPDGFVCHSQMLEGRLDNRASCKLQATSYKLQAASLTKTFSRVCGRRVISGAHAAKPYSNILHRPPKRPNGKLKTSLLTRLIVVKSPSPLCLSGCKPHPLVSFCVIAQWTGRSNQTFRRSQTLFPGEVDAMPGWTPNICSHY